MLKEITTACYNEIAKYDFLENSVLSVFSSTTKLLQGKSI